MIGPDPGRHQHLAAGDDLPGVAGNFDLPEPSAVVGPGPLLVSGWAYDAAIGVSRIEVYLGERPLGRAALLRPRPDVAAFLGDDDAGLSGFELLTELASLALVEVGTPDQAGEVPLRAVVRLLDGSIGRLAARGVRIAAAEESPETAASQVAFPPVPTGAPTRREEATPDNPLRVLWHERSFGQGGSQLRLREAIEYLASSASGASFASTAISPADGPLRTQLEAAGATVRVVPANPPDDPAAYEDSVAELASWAEGRFDLVVGWTLTSYAALDVAARIGVPSLWRVGEASSLRVVTRWMATELHPAVERRAREVGASAFAVVTNSVAARDSLSGGGFSGKWALLPSGVDVAPARAYTASVDREHCRRTLEVPPERRLVLVPAMIWPPKGQLSVVAALARMRDPSRLVCALVGQPHDSYLETIRRLVERHGLDRAVRIVPFQADLRPWLRAADAVASVSESESLPAVVLEAMAFGLPVIGTAVGDVPLLLEGGHTGWLCGEQDLASLVDCLEQFAAASSDELAMLGRAGARLVADGYDRAVMAPRLAELLRCVAGGSAPDWLDLRPL